MSRGSILVVALLALPPTTVTAAEQAWEFSPYKVQIWLATETAGELHGRDADAAGAAGGDLALGVHGGPGTLVVSLQRVAVGG